MVHHRGTPVTAAETKSSMKESLALIIDPTVKRKLILLILGSLLVSSLEVIGLLLIVPLVQLISSQQDSTGFLKILEEFFGNPNRSKLTIIIAGMVMTAFIVKAIFVTTFRWWATGVACDEEAKTSTNLLHIYMHAPYWIHLDRNTAEFVRTMNESVSQTYSAFIMGWITVISESIVAIGIAGVLIAVQPVAAISIAIYFLTAGLIYMKLTAKRSSATGRILNEDAIIAYKTANQALGSIKEVKIRNRQSHFVDQFRESRRTAAKAKRVASFLNEFPKYLLEVIFMVGVGMISMIVVSRSTSKDVLGLLALFIAAGFRLLPSIVRLMSANTSIRIGRRGFDIVVADLRAFPNDISSTETFTPVPLPFTTSLSVDDVTFSYRAGVVPVLRGVSFEVRSGESLGVVGLSGAGKSTLVDLILGLHLPDSGTIRVDGHDIAENLPGWQTQIGLVPQDVYLLDDTIAANIAFGIQTDEIDQDRLHRAIDLAQLNTFVAGLPHGLESIIGERGMRISGGQRQRLGIARSLYLDPALLILDEATSSLDGETESRISETIQDLHGTLTMIVIAHRLSTITKCDRILFLEDGEVSAIGTFDELIRSSEGFANLARLARVGAEPELDLT